jgi:hypothetical protein
MHGDGCLLDILYLIGGLGLQIWQMFLWLFVWPIRDYLRRDHDRAQREELSTSRVLQLRVRQ